MKRRFIIYLSLLICLFLNFAGAEAQYWQRITNLPALYSNNYWLDVYFLPSNPQYGWICGFNGMVLRTTDGGNSWAGSTVPSANHLESIHFPTTTIGYTSGAEGIFKSTDGGLSWANVTPSGSNGNWGNFFLDANNGIVVGSGCLLGQEFWRTTNGGASWTVFRGTEPNSGLCDAILYPTGEGYASSSGRIWLTTDFGFNWTVKDTTGTEVWEEEITHIGQSFLVPTAGTTCTGGGGAGGMRFTTDDGVSWNSYSTGEPMFGAFLIDGRSGWACGYNRALYYTSDGGQNWVSKNCGIYPGNLDDIWFIDAVTGWVVGQGIYKLSPSTQTVSKTVISFPEACVNNPRWDTLYVNNFSEQLKSATYTISGPNAADFSVVTPTGGSFSMAACDSQVFIIRFNPSTLGSKTAALDIVVQSGPNFSVALNGVAKQNTTTLSDTLLIVDSAKCGVKTEAILTLKAKQTDELVQTAQYMWGEKEITFASVVPSKINPNGSDFKFSFTPKDTGWQSARYKLHLNPCDIDTFVTVRFFGLSPILSAEYKSEISGNCKLYLLDTIEICNNGNEDLKITKADFIDKNTGYSIIGWASNQSLPVIIYPGDCDTIFIKFEPLIPGIVSTRLRLENNDVTTARGNRNPYDIGLKATQVTSKICLKDTIIDLGKICTGDTSIKESYIINTGNLNDYILRPIVKGKDILTTVGSGFYPTSMNKNDSVKVAVTVNKKNQGIFSDTLYYISSQCNDTLRLIVKGEVVYSDLTVNPSLISGIVFTNQTSVKVVQLKNTGLTDINILNYSFQPPLSPNWQVKLLNTLPITLIPKDSVLLTFEFLSTTDTILNAMLCFETSAICPVTACLNVNLESSSRSVEIYPNSLNYGIVLCNPTQPVDTVYIANTGQVKDTILRIEIVPSGSEFSLLNMPSLPFELIPGAIIKLAVRYDASAMKRSTAELQIESSNMKGSAFRVALNGEFRKSLISPNKINFAFDTLEKCDKPVTIKRWVYNNGNLEDTLILYSSSNEIGFTLTPTDSIILKALDSVEISVLCNPPEFISTGSFKATWEFESRICKEKLSFDADVLIIKPQLSFDDYILDFGSVWINSSQEKEIVIRNLTEYPQLIVQTDFANGSFSFAQNYPLPLLVPPMDSIKLKIHFDAKKVAVFTDTLKLITGNSCPDTISVQLKAKVPDEVYYPLLSIAEYSAEPGENISFFVHSDSVLSRVAVSRFYLSISFDQWLFIPTKIYSLLNSSRLEIPFNYSNGTINLDIAKPGTDNFFSKSSDIIEVYGLTLISSPDFTPLKIDSVYFESDKSLLVGRKHGLLKLSPVCHPIAALRYKLIPEINLNNLIINNDESSLSFIINNYTGELKVKIYDINGRALFSSEITKNEQSKVTKIDYLPQSEGIYLLNIQTDNGTFINKSFLLVR